MSRLAGGAFIGTSPSYGSATQPIYWDNGIPKATTYSLSATIEGSEKNRMAWYAGPNTITGSLEITTDGSYLRGIGGYVNASYALSAKSAIINDWIRTVGQTGWYSQTYGGGWYMKDSTYIRNWGSKAIAISGGTAVAGATANTGILLLGAETGAHLAIDTNSIMAKATGTTTDQLYLNKDGSRVNIGSGGLNIDHEEDTDTAIFKLYVNGDSFLNGNVRIRGDAIFGNNDEYYIKGVPEGSATSTEIADASLKDVKVRTLGIAQTDGKNAYGISLKGGPAVGEIPDWGIFQGITSSYGTMGRVTADEAVYFTLPQSSGTSGWIFRQKVPGTNLGGAVASISGVGTFSTSVGTATHIDGNQGKVMVNSTAPAGYLMLTRIKSTDGVFTEGVWNHSRDFFYTPDTTIAAGTNSYSHAITLLNQNGLTQLKNLVVDNSNHSNSTAAVGKGVIYGYKASTADFQSGQLVIGSTSAAYSSTTTGGLVAVELWRGAAASWQILNNGTRLYFKTNYYTEDGGVSDTTYKYQSLALDTGTGAGSIPYLTIGKDTTDTSYRLFITNALNLPAGVQTSTTIKYIKADTIFNVYRQNNAKGRIQSVMTLWGSTYGNTATDLISGTVGVFSYGDGGPQIDFSTTETGNQRGAIIFTDNDSAGRGASFHIVSNQDDWSVNSKRFVAKMSVTIGQNLQNNLHNLYVNEVLTDPNNTTRKETITAVGINGDIQLYNERKIYANTHRKKASSGIWDYTPYTFTSDNNTTFAHIGAYGSNNTLEYLFIGTNPYLSTDNLRILPSGWIRTPRIGVNTDPYEHSRISIVEPANGESHGIALIHNSVDGYAITIQKHQSIALDLNLWENALGLGIYQEATGGPGIVIESRADAEAINICNYNLKRTRPLFYLENIGGSTRSGSTGMYLDISEDAVEARGIEINNKSDGRGISIHNEGDLGGRGLYIVNGENGANYGLVIDNGAVGSPMRIFTKGSTDALAIFQEDKAYDTAYALRLGIKDGGALYGWTYSGKIDASSVYATLGNFTSVKVTDLTTTTISTTQLDFPNRKCRINWGTPKTAFSSGYDFGEMPGLNISQGYDETSGINFNGDWIDMWSPCDSYSLRYWDTDEGEEVWSIDDEGLFSGIASRSQKGYFVPGDTIPTTAKTYLCGQRDLATNGSGYATLYYSNSVYIQSKVLYGAAWNDYAEYRQTKGVIEPGRVVVETGKGDLVLSQERLQPGANVVSDTFGFVIGETEDSKTPLAVAGRVLVFPYEDRNTYQPGDAVCSGPNGTVSKMTREEIIRYPERIVGTVSEIPEYETWGSGNVAVNGRIWVKVK